MRFFTCFAAALIGASLLLSPCDAHALSPVKDAPRATAIVADTPPDPTVSEPGELISAIKARAERTFWESRKTPSQRQAEWDASQGGVTRVSTEQGNLQRLTTSTLTGVTFYDQPLKMPDSEAFRRSLDAVAFELGRPCANREYLGWPLGQTEQARVDAIFSDTIEKLKARGFSVSPRSPRAVGADISVFTADRVARPVSRRVLGIWSAGDVGLLLLMCDTDAREKPLPAKKSAKKTVKKKPVKKKTSAPKVEETAQPIVQPGMPAKEMEVGTDAAKALNENPAKESTTPISTIVTPVEAVTPAPPAAFTPDTPPAPAPTGETPFVPAPSSGLNASGTTPESLPPVTPAPAPVAPPVPDPAAQSTTPVDKPEEKSADKQAEPKPMDAPAQAPAGKPAEPAGSPVMNDPSAPVIP